MKFIFFGTPKFASLVLKELLKENLVPEAVVCNPDRPIGRKKVVSPPPVKIIAIENKIPVLQPEDAKSIADKISKLEIDIAVIAAYGKILSQNIINLPHLGTLGIHPSLLPKYRGASPIQNAILNDEKETGVTIYKLDGKMDHGPIISQESSSLNGNETYLELEEKLAIQGGKLFAKIIPKYVSNKIELKPQNHDEATFTKKIKTEDAFIKQEYLKNAEEGNKNKANEIYRKILALNPKPGPWTIKNGKRTKLLEAKIYKEKLILTLVQIEGKKPEKPL